MADLIAMLSAAAGAAGATDPDFNQTVLLLHGDGTNGAQNNTFLDSSTNNFTITRNGNTTQGTFSPFSGPDGYWSNFFDGTNDRLTIADNAALRPGTSAFTIEAWVYRAAAGAAHTIFAKGASTPTGFAFLITSSNTLRFTDTSTDITSTGTVAANTWVHVAAVREGTGSNQLKLYINGVQDGTGTSSTNFTQTEEARIGENRGATDDFNGYISNFRYVIGTALYTSGFTPSTSPLTTTSQGATSSQVELLTCQSNRFLDNSTNGFTISPVNNTSVQPFSPFLPTAEYDASVNGGSGYFDGSGDRLTLATGQTPLLLSNSNFTFEAFIYRLDTVSAGIFIGQGDYATVGGSSYGFNVSASLTSDLYSGSTSYTATSPNPSVGQWVHVAWVRTGSTFSTYLNGSRVGTVNVSTATVNDGATSYPPSIGAWATGANQFNGYISNARLIKGSGGYDATQTTITPPTAPLTAITNTSLLCNFTNAGIFDNTGKNNLETVGNAQIDTTTKKFGTGSIEFDGNDYMVAPAQSTTTLEGDFTVEGWVYLNSGSIAGAFVCIGDVFISTGVIFYMNANGGTIYLRVVGNDANIVWGTSQAISTQTWTHIAFVRSSGTITLYVNGNADSTTASNTTVFSGALRIGNDFYNGGTGSVYMNGFIDDLRITKGVARYTANFTPPDAPFPNQ